MQGVGLHPMAASDEEEAAEGQADSASSEEDIDQLDDDSEASSGDSKEEEEEEEVDEGAAGNSAGGVDRSSVAAKKQKTGVQANGLGSVGWDASDEEEDQAVPADAGTFPPLPASPHPHHKRRWAPCCFPCYALLEQPLLSHHETGASSNNYYDTPNIADRACCCYEALGAFGLKACLHCCALDASSVRYTSNYAHHFS